LNTFCVVLGRGHFVDRTAASLPAFPSACPLCLFIVTGAGRRLLPLFADAEG